MGDKKVTVRTLPSGEKVEHHPNGDMHLIREGSPLRARLNANLDQDKEASQAMRDVRHQAIQDKKDRMDAGDPVPYEKRSV
jgi:hypothetical protein